MKCTLILYQAVIEMVEAIALLFGNIHSNVGISHNMLQLISVIRIHTDPYTY
ncbi:hypothetical protein D3C77_687530 [compost metagenome]